MVLLGGVRSKSHGTDFDFRPIFDFVIKKEIIFWGITLVVDMVTSLNFLCDILVPI